MSGPALHAPRAVLGTLILAALILAALILAALILAALILAALILAALILAALGPRVRRPPAPGYCATLAISLMATAARTKALPARSPMVTMPNA
jgi:hypothetical protein